MAEPDPVVISPQYLNTEFTAPYREEWNAERVPAQLIPHFLPAFAFNITITTQSLNLCVKAGQADDAEQPRPGVQFGLKEGYLFIGKEIDDRIISSSKFTQGVTLILMVSPQPDNRSFAKLQLLDQSGLTLSVLKSAEHSIADWSGFIQSSPNINSLVILGRQAIDQPEPI